MTFNNNICYQFPLDARLRNITSSDLVSKKVNGDHKIYKIIKTSNAMWNPEGKFMLSVIDSLANNCVCLLTIGSAMLPGLHWTLRLQWSSRVCPWCSWTYWSIFLRWEWRKRHLSRSLFHSILIDVHRSSMSHITLNYHFKTYKFTAYTVLISWEKLTRSPQLKNFIWQWVR